MIFFFISYAFQLLYKKTENKFFFLDSDFFKQKLSKYIKNNFILLYYLQTPSEWCKFYEILVCINNKLFINLMPFILRRLERIQMQRGDHFVSSCLFLCFFVVADNVCCQILCIRHGKNSVFSTLFFIDFGIIWRQMLSHVSRKW